MSLGASEVQGGKTVLSYDFIRLMLFDLKISFIIE